jgi:Sap-like sulfolipid-1-addressing protein
MVLDLLLIGLAVALDPLPLSAFVVVLPSKRGVRKGAAFLFGWLVSLAIVVTVTLLATGNNPPKPDTVPSLASLAVKIAIGTVLVVIAIRQRRRMRGPKKPKKPPKWRLPASLEVILGANVIAVRGRSRSWAGPSTSADGLHQGEGGSHDRIETLPAHQSPRIRAAVRWPR